MKLYEYDLHAKHKANSQIISRAIEGLFSDRRDEDIKIYLSGSEIVRRSKIVKSWHTRPIIEEAYLSSFSLYCPDDVPYALKSLGSCKFVHFEDDGVVRICFTHDGDPNIFDIIGVNANDVSELLISTDFFDLI